MSEAVTREEKRELLRVRMAEAERVAGLNHSRFARYVLFRDPREVRRWLDGSREVPMSVVRFLEWPWKSPWPVGPGYRDCP